MGIYKLPNTPITTYEGHKIELAHTTGEMVTSNSIPTAVKRGVILAQAAPIASGSVTNQPTTQDYSDILVYVNAINQKLTDAGVYIAL